MLKNQRQAAQDAGIELLPVVDARRYICMSERDMATMANEELVSTALLLLDTLSPERAYKCVCRMLTLAMSRGSDDGRALLARMFARGWGVTRNILRALEIVEPAVARKNGYALFLMGFMYSTGNEILPRNVSKAVALYEEAAALGNCFALCNLGIMFQNGEGVPADAQRSVAYYQEAAKGNDLVAIYNLALCYDRGIGVEVDRTTAIRLYTLAASRGYPNAMCNLGFAHGALRSPEGLAKAVKLYRLAAEHGHLLSSFNLGCSYRDGAGVPRDDGQSAHFFHLAAKGGYPRGQYVMGLNYKLGRGVPVSPVWMKKWLFQSADDESDGHHARAELGNLYRYETWSLGQCQRFDVVLLARLVLLAATRTGVALPTPVWALILTFFTRRDCNIFRNAIKKKL